MGTFSCHNMPIEKQIAVLPGDGIGEEVVAETIKVLDAICEKYGHTLNYTKCAIGGAGFDECGEHFPEATKAVCETSDAILFGSVGGPVDQQDQPKWSFRCFHTFLRCVQTLSLKASTLSSSESWLGAFTLESTAQKGTAPGTSWSTRQTRSGSRFNLHSKLQ